jgi:DNA polymerase-3 subunit epsilon
MNLDALHILVLDCQTTGANPVKGHLLEMGWLKTRAGDAANPRGLPVESVFVRLPPNADIPPAVRRVTGLSNATLDQALPVSDIWEKVAGIAHQIAEVNRLNGCPTLIHYARFEESFLRDMHAQNRRKGPFPLHIICSHEIARRLLPGLPRKGLRAVAGYFGHSVPRLRRAGDHVVATAVIWQHLVRQLQAQHGITDLDQLIDWLSRTAPQNLSKRIYPMNPASRLHLPDRPGIYRMRRSNGDVLYIGKAALLKQRVNSYFRPKGVRAEHTLEMLSQAADLDVTPTASALEAAVLESDEIKRLAPPYNVALQKKERKLVFFSSDLRSCSDHPDRRHCIGPLPDGTLPAAITALGTWHANCGALAGDDLLPIASALLGKSEACAPPHNGMIEGLALFRRYHRLRFESSLALRFLTGLGFSLWRERLANLARMEHSTEVIEASPGAKGFESQKPPVGSPEAVAGAVEKLFMHSACLIRRARWLCLLSESTLAWEDRSCQGRSKHVLLIENGLVSRRAQLPMAEPPPAPRQHDRPMPERRHIFDLATYERLRVVTTELRRLVVEGRDVEIRIKPTAVLNRRHLAALLPWV